MKLRARDSLLIEECRTAFVRVQFVPLPTAPQAAS